MTPLIRSLSQFQAALERQLVRIGALRHEPAAIVFLLLLACVPVLAGAAFVATFLAAPLVLLIAVGESAQNAWTRLHG
jgi:hypothetical protein